MLGLYSLFWSLSWLRGSKFWKQEWFSFLWTIIALKQWAMNSGFFVLFQYICTCHVKRFFISLVSSSFFFSCSNNKQACTAQENAYLYGCQGRMVVWWQRCWECISIFGIMIMGFIGSWKTGNSNFVVSNLIQFTIKASFSYFKCFNPLKSIYQLIQSAQKPTPTCCGRAVVSVVSFSETAV